MYYTLHFLFCKSYAKNIKKKESSKDYLKQALSLNDDRLK